MNEARYKILHQATNGWYLFRENTTKWRGIIGVGFIGLIIDKVWSVFS